MLKIKVQDLDELNDISTELGIIAYLQSLVWYDFNSRTVNTSKVDVSRGDTEHYLLDRQLDVVCKLQDLISKESFIIR